MEFPKYSWVWWMEWISTSVLIVGCILTAMNYFPSNLYLSLAGNFGWAVVAVMWRKWSLLVIQAVVSIIYIAGVIGSL
jgi:hypothetical protein